MTAHAALRSWVHDELITSGFAPAEAALAADLAAGSTLGAADLVAVLRAARQLPEGDAWWDGGEPRVATCRRAVLGGDGGPAFDALGERLAPDAPDLMDMNWPDHKVWRVVPVPDGTGPGDTLLAGDGLGHRVTLVCERRDGELGWVPQVGTYANGLDPWSNAACAEAERIAAT